MLGHAKYLKILWLLTGLAAAHRRVVLTEAADQLAPAQSASGRESGSTAPIL
jgi:hypothetical protein